MAVALAEKGQRKSVDVAVVGGGSAATGFLTALERRQLGLLAKIANTKGIAWIADTIGAGEIAHYRINGNSDPGDFIEGTPRTGIFKRLWRRGGPASTLEQATGAVHLADQVAPFLQERAEIIQNVVGEGKASQIYRRRATKVYLSEDTSPHVVEADSGKRIETNNIVLATGAHERELAGFRKKFGDRYKLSGEVIDGTAYQDIKAALQKGDRVTFVAASHSTYAAIAKFLQDPELSIAQGQIVVVSKKEPLLYFKNKKAAQEASYTYDWDQHTCPKTGKINRFGGLRNDAKDAVLSGRVTFIKADGIISPDHEVFTDSAYIVSGIGYETNLIEIFDSKGDRVDIQSTDGQVAVNGQGQILDPGGNIVNRRLYGIGIGYGPRASSDIGGEPVFKGRLDGVNVQDTVSGTRIVNDIFDREEVIE